MCMVHFLDLDDLKQTLSLDDIDLCEDVEANGFKLVSIFMRGAKELTPVLVYWDVVTGALSLRFSQLIRHKYNYDRCACSREEIDEASLQAFNQIREKVLIR